MFSYRVENGVIVITAAGVYTATERDNVYDAIRRDPAIHEQSLLLIDTRQNLAPGSAIDIRDAIDSLIRRLGPKLGRACAIIRSPARPAASFHFQLHASARGLRVGVFDDEAGARQWLSVYAAMT
jgi:hypothetical protein